MAGAVAASCWVGLNGDLRYEFGGLRVPTGVGGAYSTFVHRPLAYRWFTAALDVLPRRLFPGDPTVPAAEAVIRLEAVAACVAACLLLALGLRRRGSGVLGWWVGAAALVALAFAPNWTFLEPDWVGVLWAVAGTGAALLARRPSTGGFLAAPLMVLCAATKLTTAPYALAGLGVVFLLDRRRGLVSGAWTGGALVAWAVVTRFVMTTEWQWLQDMSRLNPGSPLRVGLTGLDWRAFAISAANLVVVSPVVVALPAAVVALAATARGRARWTRPAAAGAGVLLVTVPVLAQAEWYQYQWVGLPVLGSVLVVAALHRVPQRSAGRIPVACLLVPPALAGTASVVLLAQGPMWRAGHLASVTTGYLALAAVAAIGMAAALRRDRTGEQRPGSRGGALAALVGVVATTAFGAANLPLSAYAFSGPASTYTNAGMRTQADALRHDLAAVRRRIGARTPVLYLTFGDIDYLLNNPTSCRFASPVWLQRSQTLPWVRGLTSYRENAACLGDPAARYLVLQPGWFQVQALEPALAAEITATYDCDAADRVEGGYVLVCPRRGVPGR